MKADSKEASKRAPSASRAKRAKNPVAKKLLQLIDQLRDDLDELSFEDPVTHVYNPLDYARPLVAAYLERYARSSCETVFLGMNPGPWGMAQTGVPFGEVSVVKGWLELDAKVGKPEREHEKRPVLGLDSPRSEVSGSRLWGFFAERFGNPDAFFEKHFVWNYCPLSFMEEGGKNRTPDKLPAEERQRLFELCDQSLREVCQVLQPQRLVGVGKFARKQAERILQGAPEIEILDVLHPSPASPLANRGWAAAAEKQLVERGVLEPRSS